MKLCIVFATDPTHPFKKKSGIFWASAGSDITWEVGRSVFQDTWIVTASSCVRPAAGGERVLAARCLPINLLVLCLAIIPTITWLTGLHGYPLM